MPRTGRLCRFDSVVPLWTAIGGRQSILQDYVERMNDSRHEPEQRKQYVEPKMATEAHLGKNTDGREQNGQNNLQGVCLSDGHGSLLIGFVRRK